MNSWYEIEKDKFLTFSEQYFLSIAFSDYCFYNFFMAAVPDLSKTIDNSFVFVKSSLCLMAISSVPLPPPSFLVSMSPGRTFTPMAASPLICSPLAVQKPTRPDTPSAREEGLVRECGGAFVGEPIPVVLHIFASMPSLPGQW